ncbi:MAG: hypothetical protein ACK48G_00500, partial [Chitinophagaceae bacterium]
MSFSCGPGILPGHRTRTNSSSFNEYLQGLQARGIGSAHQSGIELGGCGTVGKHPFLGLNWFHSIAG